MTTLAVPYWCDGGADRLGTAFGLRQSDCDWIGDCPGCKGSEVLTVRPSHDGDPAHVICICRGACANAPALRTALARTLGPESSDLPQGNTPAAADIRNFGGALPRKRE